MGEMENGKYQRNIAIFFMVRKNHVSSLCTHLSKPVRNRTTQNGFRNKRNSKQALESL
jgi:hypothetical protein